MRTLHRYALALVGLGLASTGVVGAGPINLEWGIVELECDPPDGIYSFGCGNYGQLLVGSQTGIECDYVGSAIEIVQVYPEPSRLRNLQQFPTTPSGPATPFAAGTRPSRTTQQQPNQPQTPPQTPPPPEVPSEDPTVPCNLGSCFSPPGGGGAGPWIAVSDWNGWHGWTMGATIRMISGQPVSLYAVDAPELTQALGTTISDGHVLASLCSLVEAIDHDGMERPAILNLSYGRKAGDSELDPPRYCDPDTISCQIRHLLQYLQGLGVTIVGSAGNHGSLLFPAGADGVLAAGSLDMAAFRWGHEVAPTWESPQAVEALAPGYGVCLEYVEGPQAGELWPAPAGSSYSAAVLAAWMAEGVERGSFPVPLTGVVYPVWSSELGCYVLAEDRSPVCNAAANQLLEQMLGQTAETCWSQSFTESFLAIQGPVDPLTGGLELPSIEEWVATSHNPAPASNFCVPCVSGGGWGLSGLIASGTTPGSGLTAVARRAETGSMVFDISASGTAANGQVLEALHLRIEDQFYPLLERSQGQGDLLDDLVEGTFARLVLDGFTGLIPSRATQPSLVYVLRPEGSTTLYWTSTPVLFSAPAGQGLGGKL